jgi:glyoxylase I family protein
LAADAFSFPSSRLRGAFEERMMPSTSSSFQREGDMTTTAADKATVQMYRAYIKAAPEVIWDALTKPKWTKRYGYAPLVEYELRPGGAFRAHANEGMKAFGMPDVVIDGQVLEADAPRTLVQTWRMLMDTAMAAEGFTRLTYEIEPVRGGVSRLTVTHDVSHAPTVATFVAGEGESSGAGGGWNEILSGLKTLLETGAQLPFQSGPENGEKAAERHAAGSQAVHANPLVKSVHGFRYQVKDVARSIAFYTRHLGFRVRHQQPPAFASVALGDVELLLSGPQASGSRPMPDGRRQEPGGWNRVVLRVTDLPAMIAAGKQGGLHLRNEMETGPGGRQIQIEDPDGNPIELFEPAQ